MKEQLQRPGIQFLAMSAVCKASGLDELITPGFFLDTRSIELFTSKLKESESGSVENAAHFANTLLSPNELSRILALEEKGAIHRLQTGAFSLADNGQHLLTLVDFPSARASSIEVVGSLTGCETYASFDQIKAGQGNGYISCNYQRTTFSFQQQLITPGAEVAFVLDEHGRFIKYLFYYTGKDGLYFPDHIDTMAEVKRFLEKSDRNDHVQIGFVSTLNGLKSEDDPTITKSEEILSVALLFRHAAYELVEKGCSHVALTVRKDNQAAQKIYYDLGFIPIPELAFSKVFTTESGQELECDWDVMYTPLDTERVNAVISRLDRQIRLLRRRLDITTIIADFDGKPFFRISPPIPEESE